MSKDELWELFKKTGKIEYYLQYKKHKQHYKKVGSKNGRMR